MKFSCKMQLDFPDEATASNIEKALELDNAGYLETRVEGRTIHAIARAEDVLSLRNTIDDYLACVSVAQRSIDGTEN